MDKVATKQQLCRSLGGWTRRPRTHPRDKTGRLPGRREKRKGARCSEESPRTPEVEADESEGEAESSVENGTLAPTFTNRMPASPANRLDDLDEREITGRSTLVTSPREEIETLSVCIYAVTQSCPTPPLHGL